MNSQQPASSGEEVKELLGELERRRRQTRVKVIVVSEMVGGFL